MTNEDSKPLIGVSKEGWEEKARALLEGKVPKKSSGTAEPFDFGNLNPREYFLIPQHNIIIAERETHLNENMYNTLDGLANDGLSMPSAERFMSHWMNVYEASQRKIILPYADGTPVPHEKAVELWNYMSSKDRTPFNGKPCWTWLNNRFILEDGIWFMETDLKTAGQGNNVSLSGTRTQLEDCLRKDGVLVNLKFNRQGLAEEESPLSEYVQGQNIRFWQPVNGRVARFDADSAGASLDCDRNPDDVNSSLGVFAVLDGEARGQKS